VLHSPSCRLLAAPRQLGLMCLSLNDVQEFDPIKYILANISEAGGDATYFDKQVSGTVILTWLSDHSSA
jgi:hypothetical protein